MNRAASAAVLHTFRPDRLEDLIAITSLYRPGPMESIPKYIHNRHHPEDITYLTPALRPILEVTYGCIVYQEQVMQIFRRPCGLFPRPGGSGAPCHGEKEA